MAINAYENIKEKINIIMENYDLQSTKELSQDEIEMKLPNFKYYQDNFNIIDVKAYEITFTNGLIYLKSNIKYQISDYSSNIELEQHTFFPNYSENALLNIQVLKHKKSLQELLGKGKVVSELIPDYLKTNLFLGTSVFIRDLHVSDFETIKNNNTLIIEKYRQYYRLAVPSFCDKLLNLCNSSNEVEITYLNNQHPLSAEFTGACREIADAGFNSTSQEDISTITYIIQEQLKEILLEIEKVLAEEVKENKDMVKRLVNKAY